jgi:cephalosporin hydroxylase
MSKPVILSFCCLFIFSGGCRRTPSAPISEIALTDKVHRHRVLRGVYDGAQPWRWTSRVFAVSLDPPQLEKATYLELDFTVPAEIISEFPAVTLIGRVNGVEVGRQTYYSGGRFTFTRHVPLPALKQRPAEVEFELDKSITDPKDGRILGLIAVSVALKDYEQTAVFRETQVSQAREGYRKLVEQYRSGIPPERYREMMRLFHDLPVWQNMWFQSVRLIKNPLDLWMMQQIIYEVQPDFIVETGTWYGGSALYWAHTLNGMRLENSRVLTIDLGDFTQGASTHFLWKKYVQFFRGSSTDPAIVSRIASRVKGRKTIVTLDSDHSMDHVLRELRLYSPLVSPGSYLIVEDTHLDGVPTQPDSGPGPMAAVQRFLAEGGREQFDRDLTREALVMTFNPGGWLRRK